MDKSDLMQNDQDASMASKEREATDDEIGDTLTMADVLEQENEDDEAAFNVLGSADDKNCSYSEGYLKRQAVFSCRTCFKGKPAGICLACSNNCHDGHDIIELYTKRNFRCDCGNSLFGESRCSLDPIKDDLNEKNCYNQNFSGVYCTCHRPYPDPDGDEDDHMSQCVVCEDWYHHRHLVGDDLDIENIPDEIELVCQLCSEKYPFLTVNDALQSNKEENVSSDASCKIAGLDAAKKSSGAKFWPVDWRQKLCQCVSCQQMFSVHKLCFLLDAQDPVVNYTPDSNKLETRYERGMRALSSLDHVQQVEAIQGYNDMKTALMERLKEIQKEKKVVSESDIREFFSEFQAKRRRVMAPPSFCR